MGDLSVISGRASEASSRPHGPSLSRIDLEGRGVDRASVRRPSLPAAIPVFLLAGVSNRPLATMRRSGATVIVGDDAVQRGVRGNGRAVG
jgi:hypothetical protein